MADILHACQPFTIDDSRFTIDNSLIHLFTKNPLLVAGDFFGIKQR